MTTAATRTCLPSDFADPNAFDLGAYEGTGSDSIETAIMQVRTLLDGLSESFGIAKVQFTFNCTPAVMTLRYTNKDVLADWATRRAAYQRVAGIA